MINNNQFESEVKGRSRSEMKQSTNLEPAQAYRTYKARNMINCTNNLRVHNDTVPVT